MNKADTETLERELTLMTDVEVRSAYLATDRTPEDELAYLLAGECERRDIEI